MEVWRRYLENSSLKIIMPSRYLIANLDVLGIKKQMSNDKNLVLSMLYSFIREAKKGNPATQGLLDFFEPICFSDNIVLAYNTSSAISEQDYNDKCHYLILYVLCLQTQALAKGFFLRGSIKFGDLYIDKEINFTCGKGLVETHQEESELPIYPRVITTDKNLLEIIGDISLSNGHILKDVFIKDFDGLYFLDFLQMLCIDQNYEEIQLQAFRDNYMKYLMKNREINFKIQQKHDWFITYFNNFCDRKNLNQYKIEVLSAAN